LGTVTFRDLLITAGDRTVRDVMRTDVVTAAENLDREALKQLFMRHNLQMIPIVDADRQIKKIVTKDDLATA